VSQAQWWNPNDVTNPKDRGQPWAPKIEYNSRVFNDAQRETQRTLNEGDFEKLERMNSEFLAGPMRTTDGRWMTQAIQDGFDAWATRWSEPQILKTLADWKEKVPSSRLRPVAEAVAWQRLAWKERGGGYAASVTPEGGDLFKERLRKAAAVLNASAATGKESPIWYWVALIVAGSSGRPATQFDALFNEAASRFPTYLPLYLTRVNYLLPQWGGDYDQVDEFVERAVKRTQATEGRSFYALIYRDLVSKHVGDDFFAETRVTWPGMRDSFEDLTKRYPGITNFLSYAAFACLARDRETTARLLSGISPDYDLAGFAGNVTSFGCRRFAFERS